MGRWRGVRLVAVVMSLLATVLGVLSPGTAEGQQPADPDVFAFGDAGFHGSTGGLTLARPIVDLSAHPAGTGYWNAASDGGVFAFGAARFFGSMGGRPLVAPVVGMAATPSGAGYWLVASDGGVFAFGDARFFGSMGGSRLNRPVVAMAASPSGAGYWLVASDGGVFAFGDARFHGSMGGQPLVAPVVDVAAAPNGAGYWLAAADGGVFALGSAPFRGSIAGRTGFRPVVAIAATPTGGGYWLGTSGACTPIGSTGARSSLPESHVMLLTDVRTADHRCYERIVFDFRDEGGAANGAISYEVRYAAPPFSGASGIPEPVAGRAFLEVVFRGARTFEDTGSGFVRTYTGPDELRPADLETVEEIQFVEDFEAVVVWVVGLDQRRVFEVSQLDGPDRFVLDVGPPAG